MISTSTVFLLSAVVIISFAATFIYRKIAINKSILDIPNDRSSHSIPTPRGGGLAIVIAFYVGVSWLLFNNELDRRLFFALLAGLILVIVGLLDDIVSLPTNLRFTMQAVTVVIAIIILGGLSKFDIGFFIFENNIVLSMIAVVGIIWFINLYNFIDGIDGYSTMQAIFVAGALFMLTKSTPVLILAVATLGFLPWNWQKAKIFMGDVGSTLLGFVLAVFAIHFQNTNEVSLVHWLILTSLFWFDASFTLYRRWRNGEKLSQAHRKHAYQRLVQTGYSHQKVTLIGLAINILMLPIVFYFKTGYYILIGFGICIIIQFGNNILADKRKAFPKV